MISAGAIGETDPLPFVKMHGLGNDFVVLDLRRVGVERRERLFAPGAVRAIADRRRGVGCDQLIGLEPARGRAADVFVRIANADGGTVEACGNASRCVAALLFEELGRASVTLETGAGLLTATRRPAGEVCVDMGPARHRWQEIPLARDVDTDDLPLAAGSLQHGAAVNVGNPHAVFFVDAVDAVDLAQWGPRLETDPLFPERANIGVAQVLAPDHIRLRVWERGVGITEACGTAACAAVVAAARRGLAERNVRVTLDGGDLAISWRDDGHVEMTGPAATSFTGALAFDRFAAPPLAVEATS